MSLPAEGVAESTTQHLEYERIVADAVHLGDAALAAEVAKPSADFESLVDPEHAQQLRTEVTEHGMSVVRGKVRNAPNEAEFRERHGLTFADMEAIGYYRGAGAGHFNGLLRGELKSVPGRKHLVRLQELFGENGKLPQTKGGEVVYRGLPAGVNSTEPGFSSTTVSGGVAISFAGQAKTERGSGRVMRMVLPPGIRYLPAGAGEQEVILQPGIQTEIIGSHAPDSDTYRSFTGQLPERYGAMSTDGLVDAVVLPPVPATPPANT
jgi:hypothetical protein